MRGGGFQSGGAMASPPHPPVPQSSGMNVGSGVNMPGNSALNLHLGSLLPQMHGYDPNEPDDPGWGGLGGGGHGGVGGAEWGPPKGVKKVPAESPTQTFGPEQFGTYAAGINPQQFKDEGSIGKGALKGYNNIGSLGSMGGFGDMGSMMGGGFDPMMLMAMLQSIFGDMSGGQGKPIAGG